jgi:putative phosphonate metabolism protein
MVNQMTAMSDTGPRYAIYFAPDATLPLWRFGSAVLGYDADTGEDVDIPPALKSAWPNWSQLTAEPRKYGFHATLKAPFRLRDGGSEADLLAVANTFGQATHRCELQGLTVATLGRFVALVPFGNTDRLQLLAAQVVDAFEALRAPLSDSDRARRLKSSLTRAQTYYLDTYGYPYVHDEFRFHMTLTAGLPAEMLANAQLRLTDLYAEVAGAGPVNVGGMALFRQDNAGARFRIIARLPLL